MNEDLRIIWRNFFNWVMGNGARPENEEIIPEAPPDLPFTQKQESRNSRFHELTLRERYSHWLEIHGLHLFSNVYSGMSVLICVVIVLLLLVTVAELPKFGSENNPANNEVMERYINSGGEETGAKNIVSGMILDYRAFDTFGESALLFTAAVSVLMLLAVSRRDSKNSPERLHKFSQDDSILRGVALLSIPVIVLLGCVVILNGHLKPGGGFSGGAILSAALIFAANAYGFGSVHKFFSERKFVIMISSALMIYALLNAWSFFTGANDFEAYISKGAIGNIFSAGLILPLNICLSLIVAGILYGFYALFSEEEI